MTPFLKGHKAQKTNPPEKPFSQLLKPNSAGLLRGRKLELSLLLRTELGCFSRTRMQNLVLPDGTFGRSVLTLGHGSENLGEKRGEHVDQHPVEK